MRLPDQTRDPEHEPEVEFQEIAPRFFETLRIPVTQGRDFEDMDRSNAPRVAIVNETLARRMWPDQSPLERIVVLDDIEFHVVGVCKDSRLRNSIEGPLPFVYLAYWQNAFRQQTDSRMVIRVAGDPRVMLPILRREIAAVDSNVPISEDLPMTAQVNGKYRSVLMTSSVMVCSGVIALFLSMIGLYGVLAFSVTERTREIGIRMALGARQPHVLRLVVGQGLSLALIGIVIGLAASLAFTRVLASLLYGVSAHDPLTFGLIALLLMGIALLACCLPAWRAARVDPITALRRE
jgi:predicted permease